ncbi:GNAT family N-acetyltransferase [Actinoplanes teichomyceticus]|uniref:Putative acetyltransferase n=1 Tax=Actinoplanes teichomyceticus TaxID=1867 RepID=A0A561WCA2_ACTTI|nr:N-acetyltransferase [Actinoplanes teichomyceticus]TWG21477.1 putative acetyltransferase [Actinoplanes teichomyceticus]GIF16549.1 N-acetyltransferase [Actinoplanes teichomyceticus]
MHIRAETPADHPAIDQLVEGAFGASGRMVADLVPALRRDDPEFLSFVAEDGGTLIGHVMFTRSLLDAPDRLIPVPVLSPLSVAPERQRQGVGGALIRHGVAELEKRDVPLIFLEGDPAYYARHGFVPGGDLGFRKPSLRIPDAAFQVMPLAAHRPEMTGTLVYLHTFWDHDCVGLR